MPVAAWVVPPPSSVAGPSVTDQDLFVAVRTFLLTLVPPGVEVIQGQINRVPPPAGTNYVVMWMLFREAMSTPLHTYASPDAGPDGTVTYEVSTKVTMQLDVHGPSSGDTAQLITILWGANYGFGTFQAQNLAIAPLYVADMHQAPFITGEQQYDTRWIVDVVLEANAAATTPQQFATELNFDSGAVIDGLTVGLIDVDVAFPPTDGSVATISLATAVAGQSI